MQPSVSVVVPAYNEPDFLAEALRSVASQTVMPLEVVVVDDGSPRSVQKAAESAGLGPRLRFMRQENAGGAAARNRGIALAQGDWIAFLDHDDRWLPHKLQRQLAAVQPGTGLVFCQLRSFGTGTTGGTFPTEPPSGPMVRALLQRTWIRTLSTVLVRRNLFAPEAWFRTDLTIANDLELYYRIAERTDWAFVPEVLVEWRRTGSTASADALSLHQECVRVVEELAARLGVGPGSDLRRLVRDRLLRHVLGGARAALVAGDAAAARRAYRRALSLGGQPLRSLVGWLASSWRAARRR